ncbi:MAG TPA: enolase C-terminal domain-like protein [Solirubrobacterales bacterium]|jgi:L-alanine-DL-glutamate epimerase-like enolase superfamily enzyme|nr:enolase C-terminal domain-like protein [Solirubrobacterales bacterium]
MKDRIEDVTATAYTVPTDRPESDGTLEWDSTTIVVVEASAGEHRGLGYTYGHQAIAAVIGSTLSPVVAGTDPLAPPRAWAAMQEAVRNLGRQGLCAMAISAVDIALWDLRAKLLGVSLADSLGRFREAIPAYGSGGFTSYADAELSEQLRGWVERGCRRVKIKVGREPENDPARLAVAREAIGAEVELMVDANGAFEPPAAARWAQRYAEYGVSYFEEPVSSDDLGGLRRLRDAAPAGMQVAAGEYAWDLFELERLAGCVDVLQADVTRCGGITNLLRADGICRAHGLPFSAHCAPQVSAHLCCAMERAVHVEYFHDHQRVESLLFEGALSLEDGQLRPDPTRAGLGIELNRAEAERFRIGRR